MPEDLKSALLELLSAGDIESATVTLVLKAKTPSPPPDPEELPVCNFIIGPITTKR